MSNLTLRSLQGVPKTLQIFIQIDAGNTSAEIKFPDQPDLRYARILGIETFTASDLAQTSPGGVAVITDAQLKLINVTFETNDADDWQEEHNADGSPILNARGQMTLKQPNNPNETGRFRTTSQNIKYQPLTTFHRVQNATPAPFVRELLAYNNIFITWDKSFITMPTPITPVSALAVVFQIYYTYRSITGKLITRT